MRIFIYLLCFASTLLAANDYVVENTGTINYNNQLNLNYKRAVEFESPGALVTEVSPILFTSGGTVSVRILKSENGTPGDVWRDLEEYVPSQTNLPFKQTIHTGIALPKGKYFLEIGGYGVWFAKDQGTHQLYVNDTWSLNTGNPMFEIRGTLNNINILGTILPANDCVIVSNRETIVRSYPEIASETLFTGVHRGLKVAGNGNVAFYSENKLNYIQGITKTTISENKILDYQIYSGGMWLLTLENGIRVLRNGSKVYMKSNNIREIKAQDNGVLRVKLNKEIISINP